jgi:ATP-binding protein involved in chromosome partitioning
MAVTEREVMAALGRVRLPAGVAGMVASEAVRRVSINGTSVRVWLEVSSSQPVDVDALRAESVGALRTVDGVERADVEVDLQIQLAAAAGPRPAAHPPAAPTWAERIPGVRNVVVVASGKGGVGKSTVAANLALALSARKLAVGLLDADIYGPSQQLMMGTSEMPAGDPGGKILPVEAAGGVKLMSFGFLVEPDQPIIWRGPMLMKALEQLFGEVRWGSLDVLVVDLPPGTGDVALTLCQNAPLTGAVIVTTPQDVALIDARKALRMFHKLGTPVLGIIENMSHYECPACGHVEHVFGAGGGRRTAEELEVPFLGSIPLDPAIVSGGDLGRPVVTERPDSPAAAAFRELARQVAERMR